MVVTCDIPSNRHGDKWQLVKRYMATLCFLKVRLWVLMRDQTLTHLSTDISLIPKHILNHNISLESLDPGLSTGSNCLILYFQI